MIRWFYHNMGFLISKVNKIKYFYKYFLFVFFIFCLPVSFAEKMAPHKEDDQKDRKGAEETSSDAHHHVVEKSLRQHPDHIICGWIKDP